MTTYAFTKLWLNTDTSLNGKLEPTKVRGLRALCEKFYEAGKRHVPVPVAWLTDRETMYFDKEDARRDCDGFIQPLYK